MRVRGHFHHSAVILADTVTIPVLQASLPTTAGKPGAPSWSACAFLQPQIPQFPTSLRKKLAWVYKTIWKPAKKGRLFSPLTTKETDIALKRKPPLVCETLTCCSVKVQLIFPMLVCPRLLVSSHSSSPHSSPLSGSQQNRNGRKWLSLSS